MIYTGRRYLNEICDLINYSPLILRHDYLNLKKKKGKIAVFSLPVRDDFFVTLFTRFQEPNLKLHCYNSYKNCS